MLVSLRWLEELLNTQIDVDSLRKRALALGLEVENVQYAAPEGILVGSLEKIRPHPRKKNLSLLDIRTNKRVQIVTAARNLKSGDRVLVGPAGAMLAGQRIVEKEFDGITSQGVLVSEQELGLAEYSSGVITLEKGSAGQFFKDAFDDCILDMSTTPNRPDWLSVEGIARDLATLLDIDYIKLSSTEKFYRKIQRNRTGNYKLRITDKKGCPRYTARLFEDVLIMESPFWMKWRLHCMGMNAVNNVVDITNIMMLLTGQPLHPFDLDLLTDGITIRKARAGETFTTLEGTHYTLDKNDLLIADKQGAIALAGVIGAQRAQISSNTKRVLLESAYFDPKRIAHTSRRLGITTEASTRFEEIADLAVIDAVSAMAGELFKKYCRAQEKEFVASGERAHTVRIRFSPARMNTVLSLNLSGPQTKRLLKKINVTATGNTTLVATIPHYRRDLHIEEDIFEEVGRIYGYMNIPEVPPGRWGGQVTINRQRHLEEKIMHHLIGQGFSETYTLSLLASARLKDMGFDSFVKIQNPLNERFDALRPTLFVGLLDCVNLNFTKGNRSLLLFEIGNVLLSEPPYQEKRLGVIMGGERHPHFWDQHNATITYYDTKGILESIFRMLHVRDIDFKRTDQHCFMQTVRVCHGSKDLGYLGTIDEQFVAEPYFYFELSLELLFSPVSEPFYIPPAKYPANTRDLSFLVNGSVDVPDVIKVIKKVGGPVLEKVILFDYYKGEAIEHDKKNIGFRLYFRAPDRTLTDKEVDRFVHKIEHDVSQTFDAHLRKRE
jgi:phenylalanyl-tRNA synthetase beta chain